MKHKYGTFSHEQIAFVKKDLRKSIFFLLLCVDPNTKDEFQSVDIHAAFHGLLYRIGGLNSVLNEPVELVDVISLLEAAQMRLAVEPFDFQVYRKLILDAGAKVLDLQEV